MHDAALPSSDGVSSYCRFLNSELQAGGSRQLRPRPGPVANNSPRHVQNVRAANSWFLIWLVRKSRSNGPWPAPCDATFFSVRSLSSITRQALSWTATSVISVPYNANLWIDLESYVQTRSPRHGRTWEERPFSLGFPGQTRASPGGLWCPGAGARWVAGDGRCRSRAT